MLGFGVATCRRADDDGVGVDHLPFAGARAWPHRIRGDVPAGGAAHWCSGSALLWAWLNIPIPIYGTLWLLALAYFTVLMPLGVRTLAGVMLQIDKSLEECARVCGASWGYQLRTVTICPRRQPSPR